MTAEFFKGKDGQWYWRLRGRNGRIRADGGEGYKTLLGARRGLRGLIATMNRGYLEKGPKR